jgi:DnaJ like chaperone protein
VTLEPTKVAPMSVWTRVTEALARLKRGEPLSRLFERLKTPPEKTVGFAIATIALGAKIAKADGLVTRNEVAAFREVFIIHPDEAHNVARVYDLARQDVAGFEDYARRIRRMLGDGAHPLCDLLEGLFHIALADGDYHPEENQFLDRVARIFDLPRHEFMRIRAEFVPDAERDPYDVLGVPHGAPMDEVRRAWRNLVRETHPDRIMAHGLPEECIRMAEKRLIAVNKAWEHISGNARPAP